jgi:hypothetical protein
LADLLPVQVAVLDARDAHAPETEQDGCQPDSGIGWFAGDRVTLWSGLLLLRDAHAASRMCNPSTLRVASSVAARTMQSTYES